MIDLLKQEVREPAFYNAIIKAIATGSSKSSEISSKVDLESSAYAGTLIHRNQLFRYKNNHLYIFAKSGFTSLR